MLNKTRLWAGAALATVLLANGAWSQTPTTAPWKDSFERTGAYGTGAAFGTPAPLACYTPGANVPGIQCGNWQDWDLAPSTGGVISTAFANSGTQSYQAGGNSDAIQPFNITTGVWSLKSRMYIASSGPNAMTKTTWYILMDLYTHNGPKDWALQVSFNIGGANNGNAVWSGGQNAGSAFNFTFDKWMCLDAQIDLNNDQLDFFVDGQQLGTTGPWTTATGGANSTARISAIDLWSNVQPAGSGPFYDDFSLTPLNSLGEVFCCPKAQLTCGPAFISQTGTPGAAGGADHTITAGPTRGCRAGLLLYTRFTAPPAPFGGPGDGVLCLEPMGLRRAGPIDAGGTSPAVCDGAMSINMDLFKTLGWAGQTGGCVGPPGQNSPAGFLNNAGVTVNGQVWGRDSTMTGQVLSAAINWVTNP